MALRRRRGPALVTLSGDSSHELAETQRRGFEHRAVTADAFDRAFDRLPLEQRAILVLHHRDELPIAEVADRLGIPEGTAKSRLHAARVALDRSLAREGLR
jgi:RNA polymerase sigma-70 factor (ECF subfamily)